MLRSLYAGISGMKANQVKLDVIGNNIANVGTTAFKSSRVRFQDMVSQSMSQALAPGTNQGGVNPKQVGLGVQVAGIDTMVGQGMMQPTSRNLDVAMDGEGYLMVAKGQTPVKNDSSVILKDNTVDTTNGMDLFYTRDGALTLDNEGNLLNSDGLRVLGYGIKDGAGKPSVDYIDGKPIITYVDADSKNIKTEDQLIPLVIPEKIYVLTEATKAMVTTTTTIEGQLPVTTTVEGTGAEGTTIDTTVTPNVTTTITNIPAIPASTDEIRVRTFSIEKDGVIKAVLEGGKVAILGQIAVASFKNSAGLSKVGGNTYTNTSNSGVAVVRTGKGAAVDNSAGYGDMLQGMLEMSNVDLAEQFTDMIITTRAFQAAGKTITTGDEILQEILSLKR